MIDKSRLLALVTAKGHSSRLPKKNTLIIGGQPLVVWTIKAALGSSYVDRVVVSTEDKEIADISRLTGADVPFWRPEVLATDSASSMTVVKHALEILEEQGDFYEYVLLLQPTSPLRNSGHIDQAVRLLKLKKADAIIGVTKLEHPVEWCNPIPDTLSMTRFFDCGFNSSRSQELSVKYRINGAIYLANTKRLKEEETFFFTTNVFAYKMGRSVSVDIDSPFDFKMAEFLLKDRNAPRGY